MLPHDCSAIGRAFMDMDLDNFDALFHSSLGDLFPTASKTNEPLVYIKDTAYEFFLLILILLN
jgi:hypothetical protein